MKQGGEGGGACVDLIQKNKSRVIGPRAEPTEGDPHSGRLKPLVRAPVPNEESERNVVLPLLWGFRDRSLSRKGSLLSAAAPPQGLGEVS